MGRLITLLRPHLAGDDVLLVELAQVLSTRNRLAHRFLREHELNFLTFTGREQMLEELVKAADEFEQMDRRLKPVVSRFLRARGLSEQEQKRMIDDEYAKLERLAHQRDDEKDHAAPSVCWSVRSPARRLTGRSLWRLRRLRRLTRRQSRRGGFDAAVGTRARSTRRSRCRRRSARSGQLLDSARSDTADSR